MVASQTRSPLTNTCADDWAEMPDLKNATPSQIYDSENEKDEPKPSTKKEEIKGVLVDTAADEGGGIVSHNESLTLTNMDDDEWMIEYYRQNMDVLDLISSDILADGADDDGLAIGKKASGSRGNVAIESDEKRENPEQESEVLDQSSLPMKYILDTCKPMMSAMANDAGTKASVVGLGLSQIVREGFQFGMAGMAKHLETLEIAVQQQIEEERQLGEKRKQSQVVLRAPTNQRAEQRDDFEKAVSQSIVEQTEKEIHSHKNADDSVIHDAKAPSFENSTVSSMGDTFKEYIKPKLMQTARMPMPSKNIGAIHIHIPKAQPGQPHFIDFDKERPNGYPQTKIGRPIDIAKKSRSSPTQDPNTTTRCKKTNKAASHLNDQNKAYNESRSPRHRLRGRGRTICNSYSRGRVRSRSKSLEAKTVRQRSKSRNPRSLSRKRNDGVEQSRSRSRRQEKSSQRPSDHEKSERNARSGKSTNAGQIQILDETKEKQAVTTRFSSTRFIDSSDNMEHEASNTRDLKSKGSTGSNKQELTEPYHGGNDAIEMIPFQSPNGSSGVVIINAGECTMSKTPQGIRTKLQGFPNIRMQQQRGTIKKKDFLNRSTMNKLSALPVSEERQTNPRVQAVRMGRSSPRVTVATKKHESAQKAASARRLLWGGRSVPKTAKKAIPLKTPHVAKAVAAAPHGAAKSSRRGKVPISGFTIIEPSDTKSNSKPQLHEEVAANKKVHLKLTKSCPGTTNTKELSEMINAITQFKLTAKKLGVAEYDLLQAMSFASRAESDEEEDRHDNMKNYEVEEVEEEVETRVTNDEQALDYHLDKVLDDDDDEDEDDKDDRGRDDD